MSDNVEDLRNHAASLSDRISALESTIYKGNGGEGLVTRMTLMEQALHRLTKIEERRSQRIGDLVWKTVTVMVMVVLAGEKAVSFM